MSLTLLDVFTGIPAATIIISLFMIITGRKTQKTRNALCDEWTADQKLEVPCSPNSVLKDGTPLLTKAILDLENEPTRITQMEIIRHLLANGADPNLRSPDGTTSLFHAMKFRDANLIVPLLIRYGADVNLMDKNGNTALYYTNKPGVIQILASEGILLDSQNTEGKTALHCSKSDAKTDALLRAGANPNIRDNAGKSPVFYMLRFPISQRILNSSNLDLRDNEGKTPIFHISPDSTADFELAQLLLKAGAQKDLRDDQGNIAPIMGDMNRFLNNTKLESAIIAGNSQEVKNSLQEGADPNACAPNNSPWNMLYLSSIHQKTEITGILCRAGADPNRYQSPYYPLFKALDLNNFTICRILLSYSQNTLHSLDHEHRQNYEMLLSYSIEKRALESCQELLKHGVPVTAEDWNTALVNGNSAFVLLLEQYSSYRLTYASATTMELRKLAASRANRDWRPGQALRDFYDCDHIGHHNAQEILTAATNKCDTEAVCLAMTYGAAPDQETVSKAIQNNAPDILRHFCLEQKSTLSNLFADSSYARSIREYAVIYPECAKVLDKFFPRLKRFVPNDN